MQTDKEMIITALKLWFHLENGNVKITIPMSFRNCAGRKRIVTQELNSNFNEPIITNLARAFRWQALIDSGKFSNVHELARAIAKMTAMFHESSV